MGLLGDLQEEQSSRIFFVEEPSSSAAASRPAGSEAQTAAVGMQAPCSIEAQKTTQTEGSHILVPRTNISGIPEIMLCRILIFMWSDGSLLQGSGNAANRFYMLA